jgi:hypothetical protein
MAPFLLAISFSGAALAQQPSIDAVVSAGGTCNRLVVANEAERCVIGVDKRNSGLILMHLTNDVSAFTFGNTTGQVFAFVGEEGRELSPEYYVLRLSRFRTESALGGTVVNVTGTCVVRMTPGGTIWKNVDCHAMDSNNMRYELDFVSDGEPVNLQR